MQENMWVRLRESHIITTLVLSKTVSEQDLVSWRIQNKLLAWYTLVEYRMSHRKWRETKQQLS